MRHTVQLCSDGSTCQMEGKSGQGEYTRELCLTIAQAMHGAVDKSWLKDALSKDPLP